MLSGEASHLMTIDVSGRRHSSEIAKEMQGFYPCGDVKFIPLGDGKLLKVEIDSSISTQQKVWIGDSISGHVKRIIYS